MEQARLAETPFLVLTRFYPVEPEKVWRAWTDPQALRHWFKPDPSWSIPLAEVDVQVGGRYRILMKDAQGREFELTGGYRELIPHRRLVMTWNWKNQPGHESLLTVSLRAAGKGTELELRHERYLDMDNEASHQEGWRGALDQLGALLPGPTAVL